MKKIISAAVLAAAVASFATADVKISMNGRLRPYLFDTTTTDNGTKKTTTNNVMNVDGLGAFEDSLKFAFTTEDKTAGLTFSVNVKNGADSVDTVTLKKGTDGVDVKKDIKLSESNNKFGNFFTLGQFDVWSTVFGTPLVIGAGSWKDGNADGAYRVKKDVDAQNGEGIFFERFKLGSAYKSAPSSFVDDIYNFAGGSNALTGYAELPVKINDDISLKVTAVALKGDFDKKEDKSTKKDTTTNFKAGATGRVQFNMKNVINAEVIVKKPNVDDTVIAAYIMPKMVKNLDLNIGGSYTLASSDANKAWDGAWDVDLRARYDFKDMVKGLSVTYFGKVSAKDEDNSAKIASGIVGVDGKKGSLFEAADVPMVMWNNLSARYVINDKVAAILNAGLINALDVKGNAEYGINYNVTPGAQLFFSKAASCYAGVSISGSSYNTGAANAKDSTVSCVSIPVVFRVKM